MIRMGDERMVKQIFNHDYEICNNNWCSDIHVLLSKLEMEDIYENKRVCVIGNAKEKLMYLNKQTWRGEVESKPKLRTYSKFKTHLFLENCICYYMPKRNRSLLAQFRLGILPIHVETGRYSNTPLEERICKLCDFNEIEDEYHFLIICPLYARYRSTLFNNVYQIVQNFDLIIILKNLMYLFKNVKNM